MFTIHGKGYWINETLEGHCFDYTLCDALGRLLIYRDISTVIDLGCGPGWYVRGLKDRGLQVDGYDGNPYTEEITSEMMEDGTYCKVADLTEPLYLNTSFDYVISLEVGEHIPVEFEQVLIDNLTRHANKGIILSWAVEGQRGDGHVNCRNNDYIIQKIREKGFEEDLFAKRYLRRCASLSWMKNTIMAFVPY